jgi:hypothetical protein
VELVVAGVQICVEREKCFLTKPPVEEKTLGKRNALRNDGLRYCAKCFFFARTKTGGSKTQAVTRKSMVAAGCV